MYSIDGVPLQNPSYGWRFKRASEPWVSRSLDRPDFNASNRDGTIAVRGHIATPSLSLVVSAPGSSVEALRRLLRLGTALSLTADASVTLNVQVLTLSHATVTPAGDGIHELTVVYRVAPDVWWRDVATTDWSSVVPVHSSAGSALMSVLTGTTGHVTDALVLVQGGIDTVRIAGQNSTWMEYDAAFTNGWVRFDGGKGRCFWGTNGDGRDPWADTSQESTTNLNTGAYPYFLELQPGSTGAAASTLTVSWNKVTTATTVTVRARNAYDR